MALIVTLITSIAISLSVIFLTNSNLDTRSKAYTRFVSSSINQSFDDPFKDISTSVSGTIASTAANPSNDCHDNRGYVSGTYCEGGNRYVVDIPSTRDAATKFAQNNDNISYDPYSGKITFLDSQPTNSVDVEISPTATPSTTITQSSNNTDTTSSATIDSQSVFIKIESPRPTITITSTPSITPTPTPLSFWKYLLKLIGLN